MGLLDYLPGMYDDPYAANPNLPKGAILPGVPANPWLIDSIIPAKPSAPAETNLGMLPSAKPATLPDILTGNNAAASPWNALYGGGLLGPQADPQALAAQYAAAGITPPQIDPFGDPSKPSVAMPAAPPAPDTFGKSAVPFGFAGPGSNRVMPDSIAAPASAAPPAQPVTAPPVQAAPAPTAQPAPAAPSDISFANVGGYKMPIVGKPPAEDDEEDTIPPKAAPTSGTMPASPAPLSLAGSQPGFGDRLDKGFRGFMGNLALGPIGALAGGLGALVTGKSTDPQQIAQEKEKQSQNATAQALRGRGVSEADIAAATKNPAVMKSLIDQYYGKDHWRVVQTGEDGSGRKVFMQQNADDGTLKPIPGSGVPDRGSVDPGLTGTARLDALRATNPNYARRVEAAVNGDIPLPTQGQAARSPVANKFVEDVLAVSGSTSASDFATRAATRKDYASGVASRVTKSLNTTIEHADRLDKAIDALNNYTYFPGVTNYLHDKYSSNLDPQYQKAKSEFETAKEAFVKELDFTLSGGHSSVSGSAELRDKINRADSPEALHAAVQQALHLLSARLDSHTKGFVEGTKSQRDPQDFLYPKNRPIYNRLLGSADTSTGEAVPGVDAGSASPAAAPQATAPLAPGNYVWTPQGGLMGAK